jgi:hypothetical protein
MAARLAEAFQERGDRRSELLWRRIERAVEASQPLLSEAAD